MLEPESAETLDRVRARVAGGDVRISDHGYDELSDDAITVEDVLTGIARAVVVENYPDAAKGPSVLILQSDRSGRPIHVLWGMPRGQRRPAVLITAYRPDPQRWTDDFRTRKR